VALESSKSPARRSIRPTSALCAAVLLAALLTLGFDSAAGNGHAPSIAKADATMVSSLDTVTDMHHGDEDSGHDHESVDCSPCPSCLSNQVILPRGTGDDSSVVR
jgi:hypothetical protein